jgi:hypothetical protein
VAVLWGDRIAPDRYALPDGGLVVVWNERTQAPNHDPAAFDYGRDDPPDIWVPNGESKIAVGDTVYCVGIKVGRLLLFGRVVAGELIVIPRTSKSWTFGQSQERKAGSCMRNARLPTASRIKSSSSVRLIKPSGTSIAQEAKLVGNAFQGRASLRRRLEGRKARSTASLTRAEVRQIGTQGGLVRGRSFTSRTCQIPGRSGSGWRGLTRAPWTGRALGRPSSR